MHFASIAVSLTCFPPLNTRNAPHYHSTMLNFFVGLKIPCQGTLTGITYFAKQAGTFWLDLWKKKTDETDAYVLFSSLEVSTTTSGETYVPFPTDTTVEAGLTVGIHVIGTTASGLGMTHDVGYEVWATDWKGPSFNFQAGATLLRSSNKDTSHPHDRKTPALQLHVNPRGEKCYLYERIDNCNECIEIEI